MGKTVVFDMHGIIFCHSPDFDISKSGELFEAKVREYSSTKPNYKDAWVNCETGNDKLALQIEEESILKGIQGDSLELQVYEMPEAIATILNYQTKGYKIVIIATSEVGTSKSILEYLLRKHDVKFLTELLESIDIINTNLLGIKKDPNMWKTAMKPYDNITDIYEDKEKNIEAAGCAAKELGFDPQLHRSVN